VTGDLPVSLREMWSAAVGIAGGAMMTVRAISAGISPDTRSRLQIAWACPIVLLRATPSRG